MCWERVRESGTETRQSKTWIHSHQSNCRGKSLRRNPQSNSIRPIQTVHRLERATERDGECVIFNVTLQSAQGWPITKRWIRSMTTNSWIEPLQSSPASMGWKLFYCSGTGEQKWLHMMICSFENTFTEPSLTCYSGTNRHALSFSQHAQRPAQYNNLLSHRQQSLKQRNWHTSLCSLLKPRLIFW